MVILVRYKESLKRERENISTKLGFIKNNQIIYLGNDGRKITLKAIKLTEEWIDKSTEFSDYFIKQQK